MISGISGKNNERNKPGIKRHTPGLIPRRRRHRHHEHHAGLGHGTHTRDRHGIFHSGGRDLRHLSGSKGVIAEAHQRAAVRIKVQEMLARMGSLLFLFHPCRHFSSTKEREIGNS